MAIELFRYGYGFIVSRVGGTGAASHILYEDLIKYFLCGKYAISLTCSAFHEIYFFYFYFDMLFLFAKGFKAAYQLYANNKRVRIAIISRNSKKIIELGISNPSKNS